MHIAEQMQRHSLSFEFIDAIDGRCKLPMSAEGRIDRIKTMKAFGREMVDAEYACALSHMLAYEIIIERNLTGAVILEDDALLQDGFSHFYRGDIYKNSDFVQFDYTAAFVWRSSGTTLDNGVVTYKLFRNACLATGYAISHRAATYILENGKPICLPADWPCELSKVGALTVTPRLVTSFDLMKLTSSIEPSRSKARLRKRRPLYLIVRFKRALKLMLFRPFLSRLD